MIATSIFRSQPSAYARRLMSKFLWRWMWLIALPVAVMLLLTIGDWRFLIAGLALMLVLYPGVLAIVYFNYALRVQAVAAIMPKSAHFCADGIDIVFDRSAADIRPPADYRIPYSSLASCEDTGTSLIINLISGKYDFVEIPLTAFGSKSNFMAAIEIIEANSR